MRVVIEIEIGNDTMKNWRDVRSAVHHTLYGLTQDVYLGRRGRIFTDDEKRILDSNGNTVGFVKVVD